MLIVSDSSPITNLIQIDLRDILKTLYGEIIIPRQVYWELGNYENQQKELDSRPWIKVKKVTDSKEVQVLMKTLDSGEAEAIVLSQELKADVLLMDEKKGRLIAQKMGLKVVGLIGILVHAKRTGHIKALEPVLNDLIEKANFYVHPSLLKKILGEP